MSLKKNSEQAKFKKQKKTSHKELLQSLKVLCISLLLIILMLGIRHSCLNFYVISSTSMTPNILPGDRILSLNFLYNFRFPFSDKSSFQMTKPKYGDIIFFRSPVEDKVYIKRVIGLPGDVITFQNGEMKINDRIIPDFKLNEANNIVLFLEEISGKQYKIHRNQVSLTAMLNQQYAIPENKLFVLGDSRDKSYDSRHFGYIPLDFVIGKAIYILFSTDDTTDEILPKFREDRFLKSI